MIYALITYVIWGLFPLYFPLLKPAGPVEIIGHRILWTAVLMAAIVFLTKRRHELASCSTKEWLRLGVAGILITLNWLFYVWAINTGHVAEAALGYYINPLFSVLLGVVFLGERLRRLQKFAVALAGIAVVILTILAGSFPVFGIAIALSFGFYGLAKKGMRLSPMTSLAAETLLMAPVALIFLSFWELNGSGTFFDHGWQHIALLVGSGIATAIPLVSFGAATKVLDLSTIGIVQYLSPTVQLLLAVAFYHEYISPARWASFGLIWLAVFLFILDIYRRRRKHRQPPHQSINKT